MKNPKIALLSVALNPPYWPFAPRLYETADRFFFADGSAQVDKFLWTDMPSPENVGAVLSQLPTQDQIELNPPVEGQRVALVSREEVEEALSRVYQRTDVKIVGTEPSQWPLPTLMRYHLYLRAEEELKKYDYIFHLDIDMAVVSPVGKEVLGEVTAAQHPMYALRKEYWPPYEPNPESQAFIPRPGRVINDGGKPRFQPLYFAGGFQGGKSKEFIKAMKTMKGMVDADFSHNYIPIWNDESIWNRYLFDNPPEVVLDPGYIYPDSLIEEYYIKLWGRNYEPKIVTLTKKFTTSKEGARAINEQFKTL